MSFSKLSAFSLASFELQAQTGGTMRYADAVHDLEDQISLSPQAMGMLGDFIPSAPTSSIPEPDEPPAIPDIVG